MGRPYSFPDPDDRSKNDPSIIVSSEHVLGIYNRESGDEDKMQKVTTKVRDWFLYRATELGWDESYFSGSQCILHNKFGEK
jgi:hypothetical protein